MKTNILRKTLLSLTAGLAAKRNRFGWVLALILGFCAVLVQAQELRYHYVPLDQAALPAGFVFFDPGAINESGRVYGTAYDGSFLPYVAVYQNGAVTVLQPNLASFTQAINAGGTVGGSVVIDPVNYIFQAALFRGSRVELIPRLPGEVTSSLLALNDSGMALVSSLDANFVETLEVYKNGHATPIDLGPNVPFAFFLSMNNAGIISGTTLSLQTFTYFGFRFDTRTGQTTFLYPIAGDPEAWALSINNRGDILGYSFVFNATERIGVWDPKAVFTPYFVEGTPQIPTVSNALVFNDNNVIVISNLFFVQRTSYIVPRPGVRLDLAGLVQNLPSGQNLAVIFGINNHGDMIGFSDEGSTFLLVRVDATTSASSTTSTSPSGAKNDQQPISPSAALAILSRHTPQMHTLKLGSPWNRLLKVPAKCEQCQF
jgi:hypothetical protein